MAQECKHTNVSIEDVEANPFSRFVVKCHICDDCDKTLDALTIVEREEAVMDSQIMEALGK